MPTFFKARQRKGSLPSACECSLEIEELVRRVAGARTQKMRIYVALQVSQLAKGMGEQKGDRDAGFRGNI